MEFETVFEYRHKKFGKRKRSTDEDSNLSAKFQQQSTLTPHDQAEAKRPKIEITPSNIHFVADVQLEPVNLSPRNRSAPELPEETEVIDLSMESQTSSIVEVTTTPIENKMVTRYRSSRTISCSTSTQESIMSVEPHADEIQVKNEPPSTPQPTRRRGRSSTRPTRSRDTITSPTTPDLISVKIKEELIEINTTIKEKIPEETFEDICRFHENMVRRFPKKDRSPKEQDRRNKNTVACRKSRRVRKLSAALEENEYKNNYALYKDQMREYFILEKYSQFIMALSKRESSVIVVD